MNIEQMVDSARDQLQRVEPDEAAQAVAAGAVIVDIRIEEQQRRDGLLPGAVVVNRNELEWVVDPDSEMADPRITERTGPLILMCDAGWASSLAAVILHELGHEDATDMIDGFTGWKQRGLPVEPLPPGS